VFISVMTKWVWYVEWMRELEREKNTSKVFWGVKRQDIP
jgi:hypothetical protein